MMSLIVIIFRKLKAYSGKDFSARSWIFDKFQGRQLRNNPSFFPVQSKKRKTVLPIKGQASSCRLHIVIGMFELM